MVVLKPYSHDIGTRWCLAEEVSWQRMGIRVAAVEEEEVSSRDTLMVEESGAEQGSDLMTPSTSSA